ncbi:uncharacterized protein [Magallana gigas]|uniref:Uncharacterized protein n=2 Tax=Magallana gigas TaxID=29159 RepID=A0A8W8NEQ7_MAGGI|nr:uncharacterized protein LOC105333489 isoform X1 [Crassostrea gigas]XP_034324262.1 uncharacterized protein LOC105333489 isoform X1 [Crassostrea gigas]
MDSPEVLITDPQAQEDGSENSIKSKDVIPETETTHDSTTGAQTHKDGGGNVYVEILPETQGMVTQSPIPTKKTESQKRRRRFIPLRYHSKIFKNSKKKKDKNGNELSVFKGADHHKHGARHAIEDNRPSTNSSSYASCRPFRNTCNGSCHTYMDIDELRGHRGVGVERCNTISTVSTLPMHVVSTPQMFGVDEHAGRQEVYREEQPSATITPQMSYELEMKVPGKSKGLKKYMVLFCIVLVSIVVSTVLAGYVGTKDVVDDIPTKVQNQFQIMPEWKKLEKQSNLTAIKIFLDNGLSDFSKKLKTLNEQHFENLTSELELNLNLFKNETKNHNELIQQRILNETASKEDVMKNLNTMLDLTQSNTDGLKNETKMLHELITQRVMKDAASKTDIKKTLFTILHVSICVSDCNGISDGDYQSCYTCEGFVSCSNNGMVKKNCSESYPDRPVYWDNFKKKCLFESRTCDQKYTFD